MKRTLLTAALLLLVPTMLKAQAPQTEPTRDITASLHFNQPLLTSLGIALQLDAPTGQPFRPGYTAYAATNTAEMLVGFQQGLFQGVKMATIPHRGGFQLILPDQTVDLRGFILVDSPSPNNFVLTDANGTPWFDVRMAHQHTLPEQSRLQLLNMDVLIHNQFAQAYGRPDLAGAYVAALDLTATLNYPNASQEGAACTPDFSGDVDVIMTDIDSVTQIARDPGVRVALAASAALTNGGTADIAWYRSIAPDGNVPPAQIGQHPMLVFHFYREIDGHLEMLGRSDVKHAFYATNADCVCQGDQVLYAGCNDVYGANTNASQFYLAPRHEIQAHNVGGWHPQSRHFDGTPIDNFRDHGSSGHTSFDHRLTVDETKLDTPGARYYIEGWYLVQDDIHIFNSMGTREVDPTLINNAWTFPTVDAGTTSAPALERWVPFPATDPMTAHAQYTDPDGLGHMRIATKVTQLSDTTFRYEYAMMNYDYHRQAYYFELPVPGDVTLSDIWSGDADAVAVNDWFFDNGNGEVHWQYPFNNGVTHEPLPWGSMVTFGFTANAKPRAASGWFEAAWTSGTPPNDYHFTTLAPSYPCIGESDYMNGLADWPQSNVLQQVRNREAICPPLNP